MKDASGNPVASAATRVKDPIRAFFTPGAKGAESMVMTGIQTAPGTLQ